MAVVCRFTRAGRSDVCFGESESEAESVYLIRAIMDRDEEVRRSICDDDGAKPCPHAFIDRMEDVRWRSGCTDDRPRASSRPPAMLRRLPFTGLTLGSHFLRCLLTSLAAAEGGILRSVLDRVLCRLDRDRVEPTECTDATEGRRSLGLGGGARASASPGPVAAAAGGGRGRRGAGARSL